QLAKSYEVSPDGLTITFTLRTGATFQDGTPFNATAAKANIDRATGAGSLIASTMRSVSNVQAVDPTHLVLHLSTPDPSVLEVMASGQAGLMVSPAAFNNPDLGTNPVGSGPYKV